jgi:hypothetical protein
MTDVVKPQERDPSPDSNWIVPLRGAAIVMTVFGATCLAVLVVVTAVDDKSALSTVALALAILAFSLQLIVFIAQQNSAGEQGRRNEELHGLMQGVLVEIKEKAEGTQADVRSMRETILPALISKERADPAGGRMDPTLMSQILGTGSPILQGAVGVGEQWPERQPTPEDEALVELLKSYPAEGEVGDTLGELKDLSEVERVNLKAFGDDEIITRQPTSPFDPALTEFAADGLLEKGLVEPYPPERQPRRDVRVMRLTDHGRAVARLLTATGPPPDYLPGLKEIRDATPDRLPGYQPFRQLM